MRGQEAVGPTPALRAWYYMVKYLSGYGLLFCSLFINLFIKKTRKKKKKALDLAEFSFMYKNNDPAVASHM